MYQFPQHPEIVALEKQIAELKEKLADVRRKHGPEKITRDYTFKLADGRSVTLADLFGDRRDLIVIHNMGKHCVYCTLWADGFNGMVPHFENRTAFVVASNDPPGVQKEFAQSRGWKFRMASSEGISFFKDMGFEPEPKKYWPGASAFHKDDSGAIVRTACTTFGPGDDYCSIWHLFELLDGGTKDWAPKFSYTPK